MQSKTETHSVRSLAMVALLLSGLCAQPALADIVGGEVVNPRDVVENSVVALYQQTSEGGALCTATLIARNYALTAAHCVDNGVQNMVLVLGGDIRSRESDVIRVVDAEVPRKWRETHLVDHDFGDIAVIRFEGKLPSWYHPARLAPVRTRLTQGEQVLLAGYGISNARRHTGAGRLRKTHVSIANPNLGKTEVVFDQTKGHGACHGDSGGPAFLEKNGNLYLLGVTNRGYPDGAPDDCAHEVVYTKVSAYKKWISSAMRLMRHSK